MKISTTIDKNRSKKTYIIEDSDKVRQKTLDNLRENVPSKPPNKKCPQ